MLQILLFEPSHHKPQKSSKLQKRRKDWVGLCPFHPAEILSLSVSFTKQMYYSFGSRTKVAEGTQP